MKYIIYIFIIILLVLSQNANCQSERRDELIVNNKIVPIEYRDSSWLDSNGSDCFSYQPLATAFFIRYHSKIYLITCKHVINDTLKNEAHTLIICLQYYDSSRNIMDTYHLTRNIKNEINKTIRFSQNTCYDICVIDFENLFADNIRNCDFNKLIFSAFPESQIINESLKKKLPIMTSVFYMGYPLGFYNLLYRHAYISSVTDGNYYKSCGRKYILDGVSSKGHSGSPILTKPESSGQIPILIGILSSIYVTSISLSEERKIDINESMIFIEPIDEAIKIISENFEQNNKGKEMN
jgi:hypothetical protein